MEVKIYLDSLFLMNYMINLWILQLLKKRFALEIRRIRIYGGACIGAVFYILQFFLKGNALAIELGTMLLGVLLMIRAVLPERKRRFFLPMISCGFFYSFLMAGIVRAVLNKWRVFYEKEATLLWILLFVFFCKELFLWGLEKKKQKKSRLVYMVDIKSAGTVLSLRGLLDTGNRLTEPLSRRPVCIMEEQLLAQITLENPLFFRAIPYHSVGCEKGILYGVEIPEIQISTEEACYVAKNVICAGVGQKLSVKNAYQMILHPALLSEENRKQ